MLRCPKCRELMRKREGTGHYGAKLTLFQCPGCLGIWVDRDVAFAINCESALEADSDTAFEEISVQSREAPAYCPRCEVYLSEQTGGGLPQGLHIDYCTACHGFWFDRGELMIYKSFLEKKREKSQKRVRENEARKKRERAIRESARKKTVRPVSAYNGMSVARSLVDVLFDLWI